jgi:hypothetical protein
MAVPENRPVGGAHPGDREPTHEGRLDRLVGEAIETEYETGRREATAEEAKAHVMVRVGRILLGSLLCFVGVLGLLLPVLPGWILLIPGLVMLSFDVPFAARLLDKVKHRMPQDEAGNLPRSTIVLSVGFFVVMASASLWWTVFRPH